jgi:hypothetical protein
MPMMMKERNHWTLHATLTRYKGKWYGSWDGEPPKLLTKLVDSRYVGQGGGRSWRCSHMLGDSQAAVKVFGGRVTVSCARNRELAEELGPLVLGYLHIRTADDALLPPFDALIPESRSWETLRSASESRPHRPLFLFDRVVELAPDTTWSAGLAFHEPALALLDEIDGPTLTINVMFTGISTRVQGSPDGSSPPA